MSDKKAGDNLRHSLPYDDLREWIAEAERLGELRCVTGATWEEDIGMASELISHSETAPAVIFDAVPGCRKGFRVLVNVFGGKRMSMSLGFPTGLSKVELSEAFMEACLDSRALVPPEFVKDGPVFENVVTGEDVDLEIFPAPKWHENDGGRYIGTACFNVTRDPDTGWVNLGTYRIMVKDARHVSYNAALGKHGRVHHDKYIARKEPMPVAMVIGGDPMTFFIGGSELPDGMCEYDFVGGLRGKPVKVIEGPLTGLPIPANAEIVLEGFVDPEQLVPEGPFGDWTGTYTEKGRFRPLVEIKAIYHRNDPIILGMPPQRPPDEYSRFSAITRSALLKRNIERAGVPDVSAVWCHEVGGARMLVGVSIRQRYPGHAKQAGHVASFCHLGAYSGKWVIVVDDDIDVSSQDDLLHAWLTRADPATSIDFVTGTWVSPADPRIDPEERARGNLTTSRAIVDACRPYHWRDRFPEDTDPSPELARRARDKFSYLLE